MVSVWLCQERRRIPVCGKRKDIQTHKEMVLLRLQPIGVIRSPFKIKEEAPRQGRLADAPGQLEIYPQYAPGLKNMAGQSHLFVLYWCHLAERDSLIVHPPWAESARGVFTTRSPNRPNPIALDVVELLALEGNTLHVRGLDALDGSLLLDIKPYSSDLDSIPGVQIPWSQRVAEAGRHDTSK
jgi:tRNA-Thr(GGU) m(6)t(6)A37 methyltransferase TsaA